MLMLILEVTRMQNSFASNVSGRIWEKRDDLTYERPSGWVWYSPDKQPEQQNKQQPAPSKQASEQDRHEAHDRRIERLKKAFERAERIAIDNPTMENVVRAQYLFKLIHEKSEKFANMWQLVALLDAGLIDYEHNGNSLNKRTFDKLELAKNAEQLKYLAKDFGLVFEVSFTCPYCIAFAPIVKELAQKYGFQLIAVSKTGQEFEGIAGMPDRGFLRSSNLNPKMLTPTLYVVTKDGDQIYPVARGIVDEDQLTANIIAVIKHYKAEGQYAKN